MVCIISNHPPVPALKMDSGASESQKPQTVNSTGNIPEVSVILTFWKASLLDPKLYSAYHQDHVPLREAKGTNEYP
jgi:hypothetical protein